METPVFGGPRHLDVVHVHAETVHHLGNIVVEAEPVTAEAPDPDESVEITEVMYEPFRYVKDGETAVIYVRSGKRPEEFSEDVVDHWEDLPKASELQQ